MKSFSALNDCCKRKFVGVDLAPITAAQLRAWCRFNGFDNTKSYSGKEIKPHQFNFHTTVFYTETYHDTQTGEWRIEPFDLIPIGFEMLGEEKNVPVILVDPETPMLRYMRGQYEQMGFKDKWPSYKPHISLSYSGGSTVGLSLPDFALKVNRVKITNVGE